MEPKRKSAFDTQLQRRFAGGFARHTLLDHTLFNPATAQQNQCLDAPFNVNESAPHIIAAFGHNHADIRVVGKLKCYRVLSRRTDASVLRQLTQVRHVPYVDISPFRPAVSRHGRA